METLINRILRDGKCCPGGILKIDKSINHQTDLSPIKAIAIEFIRRYASTGVNKVLTIEASGVAPAIVVRLLLDLLVVFVRKKRPSTVDSILSTTVFSFTRQRKYDAVISKNYLTPNDRVVFIGDFLAHRDAVKGIVDLCRQVGVELVGMGFVIGKTFQHGRGGIEAEGVRCESLAMIGSLGNYQIKLRNIREQPLPY